MLGSQVMLLVSKWEGRQGHACSTDHIYLLTHPHLLACFLLLFMVGWGSIYPWACAGATFVCGGIQAAQRHRLPLSSPTES